jgi:putative ABC transport system ATP-binding protein
MLRLERISKRYRRPDGSTVGLNDVTLEVQRGQLTGLFGPSGAGKTTLLRIAAGLCRPASGIVTYNGERLDRMSAAERGRFRRREIACAWRTEPWQAHLDVGEHVALPLLVDGCGHRNAARRAREALLACEVEQCVDMEVHEISDGERERVAIARAIVTEPQLVLADGPAAGLSLSERERIVALLAELAHRARVAVLATSTDAHSLLGADPILYLRDGSLLDPEPMPELGRVYAFPPVGSRRAAADA